MYRKGLYPTDKYPWVAGVEGSGIVVALPTDETVLNDKWYKLRDIKLGGRVAIVSICISQAVTT